MKDRESDTAEGPDRQERPHTSRIDKIRIPQQKRSKNTKSQIVEAAMNLFSEKGYHHTNTKEITAAAGVATGSFYSYFKDKREVFIEALTSYESRFNALVNEYLERTMDDRADKRAMMAGLIKVLVDAHNFFTGLHNDLLIMRLEDPEIDRLLKEEEKRDIEITRNRISQWKDDLKVLDLEAAAVVVFGATHRVVDMISLRQTDIPPERLIGQTADMIVKYLYE